MKTVIICLICLTGIFTFVELHDSSKNEQQLNIRSVSDRKSSVNPITLDQTKLKNEMPEDIVEHTIQTTSKVSSNKKKSKTNVSINLIAEQEILSSPSPENLGPFETELLKNEITSDQLSVNNTVNSINLTDKEPVIQTEGIKVLSAKIEKMETEGRLFSDDQQKEKEIISVNLNDNSGQSINIENIEPQVLANKSETSFWKNQNTKAEETSASLLVEDDNTPPVKTENKSGLTIMSESIETNIPVNSAGTTTTDANNMEKQAEDNSMTSLDAMDNQQNDVNDTKTEQTIISDENEKLFEEALMSNMKGNHQYAINLYERLLDENPEHKEALYNLAMSKIELNSIKEGCVLLNKSLKKGVTQAKDMIYQYCRW